MTRRLLATLGLIGLSAVALAQGPLTPFANLLLSANAGALNIVTVLASGAQGPLTPGANLGLRATAGALNVVLSSGQVLTSGTAPAVSNTSANSCGTTTATIAGTDAGGIITVGATSGTSCTVTFATAYAHAPACVANNQTTANILKATTTQTTVILAGTMVAADKLNYVCVGF